MDKLSELEQDERDEQMEHEVVSQFAINFMSDLLTNPNLDPADPSLAMIAVDQAENLLCAIQSRRFRTFH